jgi:hypothetical protein
MRYRLMATYQGAPYEAGVGPSDGDVVLFAACPPPEELGFEPATGHWRKQLRVQDVQALWESKPMATYRGQRCMVLDDLGDRLHIAYLGHDSFEAQQLGYWQVDRGVFELVTPRDEVTDVTEERADYLGHPAGNVAEAHDATSYGPDYGPATMDLGVIFPADGPALAPGSPVPGSPVPGSPVFGATASPARSPAPPPPDFTVVPQIRDAPMPLEAAALRAASAAVQLSKSRLTTQAPLTTQEFLANQAPPGIDTRLATEHSRAVSLGPAAIDLLAAPTAPTAPLESAAPRIPAASQIPAASRIPVTPQIPVMPAPPVAPSAAESIRSRRSARSRLATRRIFTELAALSAIPAAAYAVGEEVDGALCLIETATGYEVFSAAGGARHEVRFFDDEESAYFYLFGVLAAEAVRTGLLIPHR